jgi:hypothetical protein
VTGCIEPDDEDPGAVVNMPQLSTSDLKKDQFMDRCMKFNHEVKAIMAPYQEVCNDM